MKRLSLSNSNFLSSVAASLRVSSEKEMQQVRMSLFPSLMCSAAKIGDMETIQMLKNDGGDYTVEDVSLPLNLFPCYFQYSCVCLVM